MIHQRSSLGIACRKPCRKHRLAGQSNTTVCAQRSWQSPRKPGRTCRILSGYLSPKTHLTTLKLSGPPVHRSNHFSSGWSQVILALPVNNAMVSVAPSTDSYSHSLDSHSFPLVFLLGVVIISECDRWRSSSSAWYHYLGSSRHPGRHRG